MRTVIRLQNHGCRKHPYWWIVVMGSYTNPKGRFVEHIGYYLPRKGATVQRAVIFNKPRALYWLAMGAQPSESVQRMLSYINMMPKPLPAFGTKYTYEKPPKVYTGPEHPEITRMGSMKTRFAEVKSAEEMNLLERELRTQFEINKQAKWNEDDTNFENVESDIEDPIERTKTFQQLRKHFQEYEKDVKKIDIRKREILFRKMNKLAEKGLVNLEKTKKKDEDGQEIEQLYGTTAEERIAKEARMAKLLKGKREQYDRYLRDLEMEKPISQQDYIMYLVQNGGMKLSEAQEEAGELYMAAKEADQYITKHDAEMAVMDIPNGDKEEIIPESEEVIFASRYTVTPFPDIRTFDPYNYYDTKIGYGEVDDPNKGYDTLYDTGRPERLMRTLHRKKQVTGRKRPPKYKFSTVNSASDRVPFVCQPNLTTAYTGLMKKISNGW